MDSQSHRNSEDVEEVLNHATTAHNDEGFQKAKEKLYFLSLEAHFFTKQLKKYESNYNKIDKNLATMLFEAVDAISEFLKTAQIQETEEEEADVFEMIPSIENDICQAHRYYYCKACNQSVRASPKAFNDHFYGNKHVKNLREAEKAMGGQGKPKKLDQQRGSTQSLNSVKSSKKERLNSLPAREGKPKEKKEIDNLPKQMREFLATSDLDNYTAKLLAEGNHRMNSQSHKKVCSLLENRLSGRFPGVRAFPFGSVVIGLGRQTSDLDVFIDSGNCYFEKPSKRKMKDAIHQTQRILMANQNQWEGFEPVTKARTPILKVFCRVENVDCDLSFSNGLSTCNTALIGYFIELQPVCRKLAAFVKFWANSLQLGTNSYLVSLMVIFYLQCEKILPSVQKLQEICDPFYIDGWHANFAPITLQQLNIPLMTDFRKYLVGFFEFYGQTFNFDKHIVSVLTGEPVEKILFDHGREHELPAVFERFRAYMSTVDLDLADEVEDLFSNRKPFVIQDPFELCHNVAKGIQLPKLKKMILFMRRTHEILSQRQKI